MQNPIGDAATAAALLKAADLVCFDADGCVWYEGQRPTPGAVELVERLTAQGTVCVCISNNSSKKPAEFASRFANLGFPQLSDPSHVYCTAPCTAALLKERHESGAAIFVLGSDSLANTIQEAGFSVTRPSCADLDEYASGTPRPHAAVVVGMDSGINYTRLAEAIGAGLESPGCDFISTNPDRTFPTGARMTPGNGVLTAAIAAGLQREPEFVGKPAATMINAARTAHGPAPGQRTVMVGDRLDTDIKAGARAGAATVALLCGVSTEAEVIEAVGELRPDAVAANPAAILAAWDSQ